MENLGNFGAAPIFRMFIRRDFDRVRAEGWFLIIGFLFVFLGLGLSVFRIFLWLGGLILFIYIAAVGVWVWTKRR
ncbi:hypothetical protein J4402_04805 [Candidatus Pacearchaeota archaeon]|nr:hypothetical protein [Candidatus Pacearchaeota archaeon]